MDEIIGEVLLPTLVDRKVSPGAWETVTFDLLRKGDVFRLNTSYEKVLIATSDAELDGPEEECNYMIEADNA